MFFFFYFGTTSITERQHKNSSSIEYINGVESNPNSQSYTVYQFNITLFVCFMFKNKKKRPKFCFRNLLIYFLHLLLLDNWKSAYKTQNRKSDGKT